MMAPRIRVLCNAVMVAAIAGIGASFAAILPYVWDNKLFIDGLRILDTQPKFGMFVGSYASSSFYLRPWIEFATLFGGATLHYGATLSWPTIITNLIFGLTFVFILSWFIFKSKPQLRWVNILFCIVTFTILAPFYFAITKDLIMFLASVVPAWLFLSHNHRVRMGLSIYIISMIFLGLTFRIYYLPFAAILLVNNYLIHSKWKFVLAYCFILLVVWLMFSHLPMDLLESGRANYLAEISNSRIIYHFPDSSVAGFLGNRIVAFITMLFPVNLLIRSPAYAPFVLFEVFVSSVMLKNMWNRCGGVRGVCTNIVFSFTLVQALFEPDYGSFFRHRIGIIIFIALMAGRFLALGRSDDRPCEAVLSEVGFSQSAR